MLTQNKEKMKNIIKGLFITILIVVFTINLNAKNEGKIEENKREYYRNLLRKEVQSLITYPQGTKYNAEEGFVLVTFRYSESGDMEIMEINASNSYLKEYVSEKLKKLPMCQHIIKSGKEFSVRFDFKKI